MTRVRRGDPTDEPTLRALQSHLREPSPELLSLALRTDDAFVSLADGTPVGYVVAVSGAGVHVAELVVHPDRRREGRAAELLRRVLADADGVVTLLVAPDNEPALALYRSLGFAVVGRRPDFYEDGDALVMAHDPRESADGDRDGDGDVGGDGDEDGDGNGGSHGANDRGQGDDAGSDFDDA